MVFYFRYKKTEKFVTTILYTPRKQQCEIAFESKEEPNPVLGPHTSIFPSTSYDSNFSVDNTGSIPSSFIVDNSFNSNKIHNASKLNVKIGFDISSKELELPTVQPVSMLTKEISETFHQSGSLNSKLSDSNLVIKSPILDVDSLLEPLSVEPIDNIIGSLIETSDEISNFDINQDCFQESNQIFNPENDAINNEENFQDRDQEIDNSFASETATIIVNSVFDDNYFDDSSKNSNLIKISPSFSAIDSAYDIDVLKPVFSTNYSIIPAASLEATKSPFTRSLDDSELPSSSNLDTSNSNDKGTTNQPTSSIPFGSMFQGYFPGWFQTNKLARRKSR